MYEDKAKKAISGLAKSFISGDKLSKRTRRTDRKSVNYDVALKHKKSL